MADSLFSTPNLKDLMTTVNPQLRRRIGELERTEDWPALQKLLRAWPWPPYDPPIDAQAAFEDVMRRARIYERRS